MPGVNPAGPYSMFHVVAEPYSVQPRSAELVVRLLTVKLPGSTQAGGGQIEPDDESVKNKPTVGPGP